tara:strand:+ start:939 stop:1121 length:183 start_codon:yes stop_codon:yes gene_type:complete
MTKKIKVQAEFDEDDIESILEYVEELKELIDDLKELKEIQNDRLQSNDKPVKRTATPKKT